MCVLCVCVFFGVFFFFFSSPPCKRTRHKGLSVLSVELLFFSPASPHLQKLLAGIFSERKGRLLNNPASLVCCRHRDCCHRLFSSAVPAALMRGMCCLMQHFIPSVCPARGAVHCIAVLFLRKVLHQAAQGMWC